MKIRVIKDSDHPWVEKRYQEQGFLRSNFAKDILVIAEVDGKKPGWVVWSPLMRVLTSSVAFLWKNFFAARACQGRY